MNCLQCQYENLADSVFCQQCGAKLERVCTQCAADNSLSAKFCRKCGALLATQPLPLKVAVAPAVAPEADRRQVTVIFASSNSGALAAKRATGLCRSP